jgi:hypothetical protein
MRCLRNRHLATLPVYTLAIGLAGTSMMNATISMAGAPPPSERLGPKNDLSVYWVGHSLVEAEADSEWGKISLPMLVGRFAETRGLSYRMEQHTLWGSPMSALWRGQPHGYKRDASSMVAKREAFERDAGRYDTIVLTESLPVRSAIKHEYSAYYLRRFYCALKLNTPSARVYVYQAWINFQGGAMTPERQAPHKFDWRSEMLSERKAWEEVAEAAGRAAVRTPSWLNRIGLTFESNAGCGIEGPIFIVPVGQALMALADHLANLKPADRPALPDGTRLAMADIFANPYVNWPPDWPTESDPSEANRAAFLAGLKLRNPSRPHDDIHPSGLGIYFATLVHFATLYRQSPIGLPAPAAIGANVARLLQELAWRTVANDAWSGVLGGN